MGSNWCENREELLDLVGRWVARKDLILGSEGLLTQDEQDILRAFFEEHPGWRGKNAALTTIMCPAGCAF